MTDGPINPDREQQRADNIASRRQSGLEPMPKDREEEPPGEGEAGSGGDPAAGSAADAEEREDGSDADSPEK